MVFLVVVVVIVGREPVVVSMKRLPPGSRMDTSSYALMGSI
jgi:hypothetical protein